MYSGFASGTDRPARAPAAGSGPTPRLVPRATRCPFAAVGAVAAACLILAACGGTPVEPEPPPPTAPVADPAPESRSSAELEPSDPPRPLRRLTIAMVGDMMLGTDYPENRLPDDDGVGFLREVAPILRAADLALGNLEGVLAEEDAEPAKACENLSACYLFRSPPRYAQHFADAGFDALSVANNHARDFGEAGRSRTMQLLREQGIAHSGRRGDYATLEWQGLKIAFLAFAVTRQSNLVHDYPRARRTVQGHALTHDLVIVSFHGGAEGEGADRLPFVEETYYGEPRGNVVRFAREMVDAGADIVFGHGPHVVRGMERYRGRLIAYSLGNFATYYGISVAEDRGVAPILVATIDEEGRFLHGHVHSTRQLRPGGPQMDPASRALELLRRYSERAFRDSGLRFEDGGAVLPANRNWIRPLPLEASVSDSVL